MVILSKFSKIIDFLFNKFSEVKDANAEYFVDTVI
jgi:hypothetical protein